MLLHDKNSTLKESTLMVQRVGGKVSPLPPTVKLKIIKIKNEMVVSEGLGGGENGEMLVKGYKLSVKQ